MSTPRDILSILDACANRYQDSQVGFKAFTSFLDRYLIENPGQEAKYDDIRRSSGKVLVAHLNELENADKIKLHHQDGSIQSIFYVSWVLNRISTIYNQIDEQPERAFPTEASLELSIPAEEIKNIEIKTDLMAWLSKEETKPQILRINFPDAVQHLITINTLLDNAMVLASVLKIRHYLRDAKNMAYTRQRLIPFFRSREIAIKDMLHTIVTSPEQSAKTILEPTEFTFQLWTQLSTNILKEYAAKTDKLAEEHAYCQSAYLIGYFTMSYRGRVQRRKDEEMALGVLTQNMRRAPYAYQIDQIYDFTDEKGLLLTKRVDKQKIYDYIQKCLATQPGKDHSEILLFTTNSGAEYYILYSAVGLFISENLLRSQKEMRDFYKRSWMLALRSDLEFNTMRSDEAFHSHIALRMAKYFPQLQALLNFSIVYFASRIDGLPAQVLRDLNEIIIISGQRLKNLEVMLKLNRKKILEDAKILLPAWMVIPGVKQIARFFRTLFLGKEMSRTTFAAGFDHEGQELFNPPNRSGLVKKNTTAVEGAAHTQQQKLAFRKVAHLLESQVLEAGEQIDSALEALIDRWNHLLDPQAKANLVTDVNNLCKDYLRLQRVFGKSAPPTVDMLKNYATKLVESDYLKIIRNKKDLHRYICVYFVYVLQNP